MLSRAGLNIHLPAPNVRHHLDPGTPAAGSNLYTQAHPWPSPPHPRPEAASSWSSSNRRPRPRPSTATSGRSMSSRPPSATCGICPGKPPRDPSSRCRGSIWTTISSPPTWSFPRRRRPSPPSRRRRGAPPGSGSPPTWIARARRSPGTWPRSFRSTPPRPSASSSTRSPRARSGTRLTTHTPSICSRSTPSRHGESSIGSLGTRSRRCCGRRWRGGSAPGGSSRWRSA